MLGRFALPMGALLALAACNHAASEESATESEIAWEPLSMAMGNAPNFAQAGNGSMMTVVSRGDGLVSPGLASARGAKAGALTELYYPHYATDNLWDSYVGVRTRGERLRWAHDLELRGQRLERDTGRIVTDIAGPKFTIRIEDVVRPKNDAHVRHVVVTNTSGEALEDVDVDFYAFYQIDGGPTGDRVRYDEGSGAFVQSEGGTFIATRADRAPKVAHCGHALGFLPWDADARVAAEDGNLVPCGGGQDPSLSGVNTTLEHRLGTIAPGASSEITYAIGVGRDANAALGEAKQALEGGFRARAEEDAQHWGATLARAKIPGALPAEARDVYRRAIITVLQHRVDNGAFIAAPTLTSPIYKLVWPRDGAKTAVDMLEAGFDAEAKSFFELLETLLKDDGSFAINYIPDGSRPFLDLGSAWNENDQPGMLPWGVRRVLAATGDRVWAEARWPAVRRVAEHLLAITRDGLVLPSRDLWELETGASWTYANGSAIAGLEGAAEIARVAGAEDDAARYSERAASVRRAMDARLVSPDGFYARGLKDGRIDGRLEIANLALGSGGFGVVPDSAPPLAKVGDLVAERLGTEGGAVRRYEGDAYYGGQPWPVASVWLSLHRDARGDRAAAERLFQVITDQAHATESLMLGEQFEEAPRRWQSAFPLVWSEAAYVRNALALYGTR